MATALAATALRELNAVKDLVRVAGDGAAADGGGAKRPAQSSAASAEHTAGLKRVWQAVRDGPLIHSDRLLTLVTPIGG
jgi:hypothetical protein